MTRAGAILGAMGQLRYGAMAVGVRDLDAGLETLKRQARAGKVPLLAANLVDPKGRPVLPPSRVVRVGKVRVGIVGLSSADLTGAQAKALLRAHLTATSPEAAAKKAVAAFPKGVGLVVVLGRLTPREGRAVAKAVPRVHLVLLGGNGRFTPEGEAVGHALMYEGGARGESLLELRVHLERPGTLVDTGSGDAISALKPASSLPHLPILEKGQGGTVAPKPILLGKMVDADPKMVARLAKVPRPPAPPATPVTKPARHRRAPKTPR